MHLKTQTEINSVVSIENFPFQYENWPRNTYCNNSVYEQRQLRYMETCIRVKHQYVQLQHVQLTPHETDHSSVCCIYVLWSLQTRKPDCNKPSANDEIILEWKAPYDGSSMLTWNWIHKTLVYEA